MNDDKKPTQTGVKPPTPPSSGTGKPLYQSLTTTPAMPTKPTIPAASTLPPKPEVPIPEPVGKMDQPNVGGGGIGEPIANEPPSEAYKPPLDSPPKTPSPVTPVKLRESAPVTQVAPATPPEQGKTASDAAKPPSPKRRGFPKVLFVVIGGVALILIIMLLMRVLRGRGEQSKGEITWWGLWEEDVIVKPLIDEYQTKNPDATVNYVQQSPQDYRERLVNAMAKGEAPDIFRFHNSWVPMLAKELDPVPVGVMSASEFSQTYFPVVISDLTNGTGLVGIPIGYDALTLFINEDIFEGAGIDPPKTWVEVREKAKQLTKVENDVIVQAGVALGRTENVDHWPEILGLMFIQNGVNMGKIEGKNAQDALFFFTLFSNTDHVWDETQPPSTAAFAAGKLAMYFGPSWRAINIKETNPDLNFRSVPLPQLPKETPDEPDLSYASYWVEGVWAKSANKQAAWDFVKYLSQKETLENFFKTAALRRGFGEAYPRVDMSNLLLDDPILGSIIQLAPHARSWYLADRTYDGPTGINSQINRYFEDAINAINEGEEPEDAVETLSQGVNQVLSQYKVSP